VDECKALMLGPSAKLVGRLTALVQLDLSRNGQGLTLVHVRAQLEQLQDRFMS
jgi:hypothetical protein